MFVLLSSCCWHHMEEMKSRWKLGISLLLFGKRRLMKWQEDWLVVNGCAISKQNLTIFMARERRKTLGPLLRCHFLSVFLGENNILLIQSEKSKTCLYNLPILVILESKYFSLASKGGEVMGRNLTLTIN